MIFTNLPVIQIFTAIPGNGTLLKFFIVPFARCAWEFQDIYCGIYLIYIDMILYLAKADSNYLVLYKCALFHITAKFQVVRIVAIKISSIVGLSTPTGIGISSLRYVHGPDEKDYAAGAGVCKTSM